METEAAVKHVRISELDQAIERVVHDVIGAAIEVHSELGPGLLEGIYEDALEIELSLRGLKVERQVFMPVVYKGRRVRDQRMDMLVERCLIVENKCAKAVSDGEKQQLRSYLRAAGLPLGLIFNFREAMLRDGLYRIYNERAVHFRLPNQSPPSSSSGSASSSSR